MALKIFPYNINSESAKDLAELLGVLRIRQEGTYVPKHFDKVLNWGNSRTPSWAPKALSRSVTILNKPEAVNVAANKLSALQSLQRAGVRIPEFTTSSSVASGWVNSGATVVERHELRGNSGAGIRIVNLDDDEMSSTINSAPLYTKFINKSAEFRVHVFRGEVIDYVQKMKVSTERRPANFNKYISSTHYGWTFARTNVRDIPEVRTIAVKAVQALGLDFGAVDVVYADGLPYVLEVNTSPGLAGTTLVSYGNAIRRFMGLSDLPTSTTRSIMDAVPRVIPVTQDSNVTTTGDLVTLRIDRATALKLKSLLASIT